MEDIQIESLQPMLPDILRNLTAGNNSIRNETWNSVKGILNSYNWNLRGTLIYDKKGSLIRDYVHANGKVWCELQGKRKF